MFLPQVTLYQLNKGSLCRHSDAQGLSNAPQHQARITDRSKRNEANDISEGMTHFLSHLKSQVGFPNTPRAGKCQESHICKAQEGTAALYFSFTPNA